MLTRPLELVRNRLDEYVEGVERDHTRVVVTRSGRPVAVLINPDDLRGLEETIAVLGDRATMEGIREGREAIRRGEFIEGALAIDALRRPG